MRRNGRMAGSRAGKLMALAALAGLCVAASMPATAGLATDTVTATNWVRQTTSTGTNYFLGKMGIATSTPSATLHVAGSVRIDGSVTNNGNWTAGSATTQRLSIVYAGRYFNTNNTASGAASAAVGGSGNVAAEAYTTIGGGQGNSAAGTNSVVGGGWGNKAEGRNSVVAGGHTNQASYTCATVGGGEQNEADGHSSFVGGGYYNVAWAYASAVVGGDANQAHDNWAVVGGGIGNDAAGNSSVIAGGADNTTSNAYAAVGGGATNSATGEYAVVPGGGNNTAQGQYSLAAGRKARALHNGALVWADNRDAYFDSTATNQFLIRASGGVGIGTNAPLAMLHVGGTARFESGITYIPPMGNLSMGSYTNLP